MAILQKANPPASSAQISSLSSLCKGVLPDSYRAFLQQHNGGYSPDAEVELPDGTSTSELSFLGVGLPSETQDIEGTLKRLGKRLRAGLLPVVRDGGGGAFCIQTGPSKTGTIWFWDHDESKAAQTHASWDDFIAAVKLNG